MKLIRLPNITPLTRDGLVFIRLSLDEAGFVSACPEAIRLGVVAQCLYHPGGRMLELPLLVETRGRVALVADTIIAALYPASEVFGEATLSQ